MQVNVVTVIFLVGGLHAYLEFVSVEANYFKYFYVELQAVLHQNELDHTVFAAFLLMLVV